MYLLESISWFLQDALFVFLVTIKELRLVKICSVVQKKTKYPYLFQYKLSYRNETGTNHHGLLST